MPFTVAHAAAALPLNALSRSRLPMAALMIGAMSPDFAYFVPVISRMNTHDLPGMFTFCLPAGLLVWLVYVLLLERPTLSLLPDAWRTRLTPTRPLSFSLLALVSVGIVLGAATHIAWDSFTHAATPVVDAWPTLSELRFEVGERSMPLYRALQYLSSLFGLGVLAIWALRLRRRPEVPADKVVPGVSPRTRILAVSLIVLSSIGCAFAFLAPYPARSFGHAMYLLLIGAMTGWAVAWCAVAAWLQRGAPPAEARATN